MKPPVDVEGEEGDVSAREAGKFNPNHKISNIFSKCFYQTILNKNKHDLHVDSVTAACPSPRLLLHPWISPAPWVAPARPTPGLATHVGHTREANTPRMALASGVRMKQKTERGTTRVLRTEECAPSSPACTETRGRAVLTAPLTTSCAIVQRHGRGRRTTVHERTTVS